MKKIKQHLIALIAAGAISYISSLISNTHTSGWLAGALCGSLYMAYHWNAYINTNKKE